VKKGAGLSNIVKSVQDAHAAVGCVCAVWDVKSITALLLSSAFQTESSSRMEYSCELI